MPFGNSSKVAMALAAGLDAPYQRRTASSTTAITSTRADRLHHRTCAPCANTTTTSRLIPARTTSLPPHSDIIYWLFDDGTWVTDTAQDGPIGRGAKNWLQTFAQKIAAR